MSTDHPLPASSAAAASLPPGLAGLVWLVRGLALLGAATLCLLPAVFWLSPDWVQLAGPQIAGLDRRATLTIDSRALLIGALASLPGIAAGLAAMHQLWRLFGEYAARRVLGRPAQRHLRNVAACMLAAAVLAPLQRSVISVALTLGNPPGQRMLVFTLSWNDYIAVLGGVVMLAVALVMHEAVRVAEENAGFV